MPVEPTQSRLRRILLMVPWVIARGEPTVEEVCERFGITPKELTADLDLLFVCGLPPFGPGDLIEAYVEGGRVVIATADHLAKPMRLSRREAFALLVVGRAMARLPGLEEAESLRSALDKLARAVLPKEAQAAADLAGRVDVELDERSASALAALRAAIGDHRTLAITYYSFGRDALTERRVDPLLVFSAIGNWYLVAWDHDSGEERVFRVDRIKELSETGERFEPPAGFDPDAYAARRLFTPSARDFDVVVELGPRAAWVRETLPAASEEPLDDGWTRVTIRTSHVEWIARTLIGLGDEARAVEPPALVDAVRDTACRALRRYR